MKINLDKWRDYESKFPYLTGEILSSVDFETIEKGVEQNYHEVKVIVNGKEFDPKLLTLLYEKMELIATNMAKEIVKEKFEEAEEQAEGYLRAIKNIKENFYQKYNLYNESIEDLEY